MWNLNCASAIWWTMSRKFSNPFWQYKRDRRKTAVSFFVSAYTKACRTFPMPGRLFRVSHFFIFPKFTAHICIGWMRFPILNRLFPLHFHCFQRGMESFLWPAAAAGDAKGVRKGTGYLVRRTLLFYDAIIALPCRYDKAFVISALFLVKTRWWKAVCMP